MAAIIETSSQMLRIVEEAMKEIINNPEELEAWIKKASRNIRFLNAALKKCDLNIGSKRHLESSISRMKGKISFFQAIYFTNNSFCCRMSDINESTAAGGCWS